MPFSFHLLKHFQRCEFCFCKFPLAFSVPHFFLFPPRPLLCLPIMAESLRLPPPRLNPTFFLLPRGNFRLLASGPPYSFPPVTFFPPSFFRFFHGTSPPALSTDSFERRLSLPYLFQLPLFYFFSPYLKFKLNYVSSLTPSPLRVRRAPFYQGYDLSWSTPFSTSFLRLCFIITQADFFSQP